MLKRAPLTERSRCGIHGDPTGTGRCATCDLGWPTVGQLVPGQVVHAYGGAPLTILEVTPQPDSDPEAPTVRLRYQWATDAHGQAMEGVMVAPADHRLPLAP